MSKDDQNNDSAITDNPLQTEELTVSEKPPVDFARLFAQDTDYGNTSIKSCVLCSLFRTAFLILTAISLIVIYIILNTSISEIKDLEEKVKELEEKNSKCYYLSDVIAEVYNTN
jgi:hypothetical protein